MGAFESNQSGVPSVTLVVVRPEVAKAEAPGVAIVGNLRQQRIEQFLDLKDLAPRTRKTYAQQLRWFSDWVDKDWQTIHLNDVRRYKLYLEQERQLKPNSVALALSSLKSFYAWLKLAGYVVENPMVAVSVPRPAAAESQNLEGFQVDALVKALESRGETAARDAAIVCLLFFAGLRANEVSGLNLAFLGLWFQWIQQKRSVELAQEQRVRDEKLAKEQREIAADETKEEVLQVYFDRLAVLLVDKNLLAIAAKVYASENQKKRSPAKN